MPPEKDHSFDVIVIGAGLAGLAAAMHCIAQGNRVCVLEAADRIGGRTWTTKSAGIALDWGAEWIIPSMHPEVMTLVNDGKLALLDPSETLQTVWQTSHELRSESYTELQASHPAFAMALREIEADARQWHAGQAVATPAETPLQDYLAKLTDTATCELLEAAIFPLTGAAPENVATAMLWDEIGFHALSINETLDAKACRISQGCGALAQSMQSKLTGQLKLNSKVTHITSDAMGCQISCNQTTFTAHHCIIAVPLMTLANIQFSPALPLPLQDIANNSNAGRVAKAWAHVRSKKPLTETLNSQSSLRYGYARKLAADEWYVCGQILSEKNQPLNSKDATALIQANWPEVDILSAEIVDWPHVPLARASWHSSRAGWAKSVAQFHHPLGNLYFAGGDIAPQWAGWMEGALLSGKAVANEVISRSLP